MARHSVIWEEPNVELLFLHIQRNQLRHSGIWIQDSVLGAHLLQRKLLLRHIHRSTWLFPSQWKASRLPV